MIGDNNNQTMKQYNSVTTKSKGLTLIEMLVAVTVFAITVGIISGLFISATRTQRKTLAAQEILNQTSYLLEYMSRALRMARKDLNGDCLTNAGDNYEIITDGIRFIDYNGICTEFFLESGRIERKIGSDPLELTSDNLQVNSLWFYLSGETQTDIFQPRVTISLEIESKRPVTGSPPKIQIQTSISQRNLDVQY